MSEALVTIEVTPDRLPVPRRSSIRQVNLARAILEADPETDDWTTILGKAGYSAKTIRSGALDIRERPGVQRALAALQEKQADSARSLNSLSNRALQLGADRLEQLDVRDLLQFALNGKKTAAEIGENIEATGTASAWKYRLKRAISLAYYLGRRSVQRIPPPTT